jgi:hypothetical protein
MEIRIGKEEENRLLEKAGVAEDLPIRMGLRDWWREG